MKLNYKRIILVGLPFFLTLLFWQCYNTIMPKILYDQFGLDHVASGFILSLDNILALFMLPIFGSLSDKTVSKLGRRTPFIIVGTVISAVLLIVISLTTNMQLNNIGNLKKIEDRNITIEEKQDILGQIYDYDLGKAGERIRDQYPNRDDFLNIEIYKDTVNVSDNKDAINFLNGDDALTNEYKDYIVPARQAYAWQVTRSKPLPLILFTVILLLILISMSVFRSPAVALMPDITPKPLRSKANGIMNIMGAAGGAGTVLIGWLFGTGQTTTSNTFMSYTLFFTVIAGVMAIALTVYLLTVKENKWADEAAKYATTEETADNKDSSEKRRLSGAERRSLILLLASVALWFIGYNAFESKYTVYAGTILKIDYNVTSLITLGVTAIAFIPVAILSSKVGRKKAILGGIVCLSAAFTASALFTSTTSPWIMYIVFAIAGAGWASINVNSFPMVVELATGSDIGKYTGYYYAASMSAQIIAPTLGGAFLNIDMRLFFPFSAVFVALSFLTMMFVKHGDSKPIPKKDLFENFDSAD